MKTKSILFLTFAAALFAGMFGLLPAGAQEGIAILKRAAIFASQKLRYLAFKSLTAGEKELQKWRLMMRRIKPFL